MMLKIDRWLGIMCGTGVTYPPKALLMKPRGVAIADELGV